MVPEETPVVSISSSTSLNPDEIPRRSFPTARKGVDGDAVRRYLETLADDVRGLLERESQLRRRLMEAERKASEPPVLDEATLNRAVGAETARVLQSAHDAAREVIARAEQTAREMLAETETRVGELSAKAKQEATALVEEARVEAAALTARTLSEVKAQQEGAHFEAESLLEAAHDDAVALLDTTKQRCRQTVRDARKLRASVLSDLVERRRALFVQLEQLRSGRDSLVEVVSAVETTVEELRSRLEGAEHGARVAAAEAGERAEMFVDDEVVSLLEPDFALDRHSELLGADEEGEEDEGGDLDDEEEGDLDDEAADEPARSAGPDGDGEGAAGEIDLAALGESDDDGLVVDRDDEHHRDKVQAEDAAASRRSVGELFARIRAARAADASVDGDATDAADAEARDPGVEDASDPDLEGEDARAQTPSPEGEDALSDPAAAQDSRQHSSEDDVDIEASSETEAEPVPDVPDVSIEEPPSAAAWGAAARARRDELVKPSVTKLARALKRALQDDQNELLNALRHAAGAADLEVLLPEETQKERYLVASSAALADLWLVGWHWLDEGSGKDLSQDGANLAEASAEAGKRLGFELAGELSSLLRHRLAESFRAQGDIGDGAQDSAGAAYREWKGPRIEGIAGDFATSAFTVGTLARADGTSVRWVVGDVEPCPDCDDNALAGDQPAGATWPTGQVGPPVHPGCRCLLVATTPTA
ncbi:MAG: DivIVA domain-containing protein [Acidimicrobiales bacterium]